jgi:hypothetical protein
VAAVADALRGVLRGQMRRRGVWQLRPAEWGYAGRSWREEETLNDLLHDCFAYVFTGRRKDRLRDYAREQPSIDAAVRRAVRNFLNAKEESKDRPGHAVFKNVQAAVAEALDGGRLVALGGAADGITGQTVVGLAPGRQTRRAGPDEVRGSVEGWPDRDALCRSIARRGPEGIRAAAQVLHRLAAECPGAWQVGEVVDALKRILPPRGAASLEDRASEVPSADLSPARPVEDEDTVRVRSERTRTAIAALKCQGKVKARLVSLWEWMLGRFRQDGSFPRQAEAVKDFGQERQRVSDDYARLRPLLVEIWGLNADN